MGDQTTYPKDTPRSSGDYSAGSYSGLRPIVETPFTSGEHERQDSFASSKMSGYSSGPGPSPNPGTYVIQIPKDHIFREPPPENAHKFKLYTARKTNRNCCRSCICYTIATILVLIVLLAITFGILYLIYHPKAPKYTINSVHVKGVNLTKPKITVSPVFNLTVKTNNPNGKISFYYEQESKINIYHGGVNLCDGKIPAFYQAPKSVTVFSTELTGPGLDLSKSARDELLTQQKNGKVPLEVYAKIPVKIKMGSVKFWTMTVKVKCDITVNALTFNSKIVSHKCKAKARPW